MVKDFIPFLILSLESRQNHAKSIIALRLPSLGDIKQNLPPAQWLKANFLEKLLDLDSNQEPSRFRFKSYSGFF